MYKELIEYAKKIHKDNLKSRKIMSDFLHLKKRYTKRKKHKFDNKTESVNINNDGTTRSLNDDVVKAD